MVSATRRRDLARELHGRECDESGVLMVSEITASELIVLGVGVDEASSISFRLRARRLVGSVTRRRVGPLEADARKVEFWRETKNVMWHGVLVTCFL